MSTTIDTKVVEAKFDNKQFESGVSATLGSLQKLKEGLKLTGAAKGLEDVSAASSKFSLGNMLSSVEGVGHSFSAMSVVGVTALATLTTKAISAGAAMVKSLTLSPVTSGFHEYETKLGSIQTVLANTAKYGTTLPQVNAALNELNHYADKTIYDFGQMTKNVGLFTNSGMRIEDATKVIEGFSNEAAASGVSAEGAAGAAYQLSQAMSAGTVRLMDFRSLTNVGLGNKNMQNGLIQIAGAMGTLNSHGVTAAKVQSNFNASLEKGWLSSDVMSNYLKIQAGALTVAQQKTLGLSDTQIAAFAKQQKTAEDAATKVRTFTQLIGTIREAVGSGWSQTFEIMFGDFNEATALFTDINNAVSGFVNKTSDARNKVLGDFKKLGGRTALIKGLEYAFRDLTGIITPLQRAFREIFPAKTGKDLADAAKAFEHFAAGLKIGAETASNLQSTFAGVFAIFSIAGKVISGVVTMFVNLFSAFSGSGGSVLAFTGHIGDVVVAFNKMLGQTKVISYFFANLGKTLATPIKALVQFATTIADMFSGFHPDTMNKLQSGLQGVTVTMTPLEKLAKGISTAFSKLGGLFDGVAGKIGKAMATIGTAIGNAITPESFSATLSLINTALFGGIVLLIKNFFNKGISIGTGGGVFGKVKDTLSQLTNTLQTMQTAIKANILLQIAAALAVLTASIFVLSKIDGKDLAKSMSALGIGFIGLEAAMKSLVTAIGPMAALKLPLITASMLGLAAAILLLSVAVKSMASINLGDMLRGLLGIDLVLKIIGKTMESMPKGMVAQAAALTLLAVALNGIALAVKLFATMNWSTMGKGLAGVAASLTIIAAAMHLMPKDILLQSIAINALAVALSAIGLAVKLFATLNLSDMGKGLLGIGGALLIIAGAMHAMPPEMLLQAVALTAVAAALNLIGSAMLIMGGMSWEAIGKGLVTLAASLLILAVGLAAMTGSLLGSAALVVAAGALAILTPVLVALGLMSWESIAKGLLTIAGVFTILGVAGLVLAPIVPVIIGLAAAMVLIGAGFALAGVGAIAFATAFGIVVAAGSAGVTVLANILGTFIKAIPAALKAFGEGIVALAAALAKGGPQFYNAFSTIISSMLKAIITNAPKIAQAILAIITAAVKVIVEGAPKFFTAAFALLTSFLSAISSNISKVVATATNIIVKFIDGVSAGLPRIIDSGVKLIIAFVNGLATAIDAHSTEMGEAGGRLAVAIVEGMAKGIQGGLKIVTDAARNLAKGALDSAKHFLGIKSPSKEFEKVGIFVNQGFAKGLMGSNSDINDAMHNVRDLLTNAVQAADKAVQAATAKLATLTEARRKDNVAIAQAEAALAKAEAAKKRDPANIAAIEARLTSLTNARDKDTKAIAATNAALAQAKLERDKAGAAYAVVTKQLNDEKAALNGLATQYDTVTAKLKTAQDALSAAIKTRDDYKASIFQQYDVLPDLSKDTTVAEYISELEGKITDTAAFSSALQALRDLGISDDMYQQLLAKGPDALPFIVQILEGGKESVDQLNLLSGQLAKTAGALGYKASTALYQAGVDSAQGIVKGLQSQQGAIEKEMERIANAMVAAVQKTLKIKSPSRVFAELGAYSAQGMAEGLRASSSMVEKAAGGIGQDALNALKKSMLNMSSVIDGNMNLSPTITPILDLSLVKKNAGVLGTMLTPPTIAVDTAYASAQAASAGYQSNQNTEVATVGAPVAPAPSVNYTQNNYSPKALSAADIYRGTNNQLSKIKKGS